MVGVQINFPTICLKPEANTKKLSFNSLCNISQHTCYLNCESGQMALFKQPCCYHEQNCRLWRRLKVYFFVHMLLAALSATHNDPTVAVLGFDASIYNDLVHGLTRAFSWMSSHHCPFGQLSTTAVRREQRLRTAWRVELAFLEYFHLRFSRV